MPKIKFPTGALVHVYEKGWMNMKEVKLWIGDT